MLSNNCTYGYKWKMVGINLLTSLAMGIVVGILTAIGASVRSNAIHFFLYLLIFAVMVFWVFITIGLQASIYKQLCDGV